MNDKELVIKRLEGARKLTPKEIGEELKFQNDAGVNTLLQELVLYKKNERWDVYRLANGEIEVIKYEHQTTSCR